MGLHVKIDSDRNDFGEAAGEYLIDAEIVSHEGGRTIELVVTRVERRTAEVLTSADVTEEAVRAMRALGDDGGVARSVEVVRAIDAALSALRKKDPEWDSIGVESTGDA